VCARSGLDNGCVIGCRHPVEARERTARAPRSCGGVVLWGGPCKPPLFDPLRSIRRDENSSLMIAIVGAVQRLQQQ